MDDNSVDILGTMAVGLMDGSPLFVFLKDGQL